jgi:hypothetical protein
VAINTLNALIIKNWDDTLTLNNNLIVAGQNGAFGLTDASVISLAANTSLTLTNLPQGGAVWSAGRISGGDNTMLHVAGTWLTITGTPVRLSTKLLVDQVTYQTDSGPVTQSGTVWLSGMTNNLSLGGDNTYIDVGNGGNLDLMQSIATPLQQNFLGGVTFNSTHTGTLAVQVECGGTLMRSGDQDGPGQVLIGGTVYNLGGKVEIVSNNSLMINGTDSSGYSYWQPDASQGGSSGGLGGQSITPGGGGATGAGTLLIIDAGGNISADGIFEIDSGTVQLTAPSGGSADELDGVALNFGTGDGQSASLTVVDSTFGTCGTVTVQAMISLALSTTTTMNFNGGNNTADLIDVKGAPLTLNGTLKLVSSDGNKPTQPLNFFDESGTSPPPLTSSFWSITDNVNGTDTGEAVTNNPQLIYYQVTIA